MAFGILAFAVVWTPALLRQAGMSAGATGTVIALHGLGALIGMASAGRLVDRFGAVRVLVPAFVIGAACTAALGAAGASTAYAATVMALIGLFVGGGASGAIALAALTYPTAIRSTGIGWAMGMGRLGQVVSPLVVGAMLAARLGTGQIMPIMGIFALVAAAFVVILGVAARRSGPAALGTAMPG
jgi:AAHS family 4-hydroxybenzoate transporter-like MFS transporter